MAKASKAVESFKREIEETRACTEWLMSETEKNIEKRTAQIKKDVLRDYGKPYNRNSFLCRHGIHKFRGQNRRLMWVNESVFEGFCVRCGIWSGCR